MRFFLLLLPLALVACNLGSGLKSPTARVSDVKLVERTEQGSRVLLTLELSNPNRTPLPLVHSRYNVELDGARQFSHKEELHHTLPAHGRQTVELPAVFTGTNAGSSYRVSGSVTYEPPGEVRKLLTESKYPLPSVSFAGSGRLQ